MGVQIVLVERSTGRVEKVKLWHFSTCIKLWRPVLTIVGDENPRDRGRSGVSNVLRANKSGACSRCCRVESALHLVPMGLRLLVLHIVGTVRKRLSARLTLERLLSCVNPHVRFQTEGVWEELAADVALVLLLRWVFSIVGTVVGQRSVSLDLPGNGHG